MICEQVREQVRDGGLLAGGQPIVAMISGGRDSTCLLDVAVALRGAAEITALHVNYGLREAADGDERHCAALCEGLGVQLEVIRTHTRARDASDGSSEPVDGSEAVVGSSRPVVGNLHARAREVRYRAAEELAERAGALIATGHTASDQVETILYRLAASPGRRALLGMSGREGRLLRPLLALTREQTAAYCRERGLAWREDESNADDRYARSRVRHRLLPALRAIHPAAETNVLRTAALLREETELLDGLVEAELAGGDAVAVERLAELPPALARMVVVRLAERAAGTYVPQAGDRVAEIIALGRRGGRAELHVGGRAGAVIENGTVSMIRLAPRSQSAPPGEG
jgi:tRNA(Ile)-lysidine synthase